MPVRPVKPPRCFSPPYSAIIGLLAGGNMSLKQPTASLAVLIYNFSAMPFKNQVELAWAAALVLVLMVLTVNLVGQALSRSGTNN